MAENSLNNEILAEIANLSEKIEVNPTCADLYYQRGRLYWKLGRTGAAMSDYEQAGAIDPDSPAVEAMRISRDIMNFYNTDLYNP